MEKRFMTSKEVAAFLCISVRTLYNYASQHELYRPSRRGVWHLEHVKILESVWSAAVTEDEGLALWNYQKMKMRQILKPVAEGSKRKINGQGKSIQHGQ